LTFYGDPDLFRESYVKQIDLNERFTGKKKKKAVGWKGI
jgi:hypothetical protein